MNRSVGSGSCDAMEEIGTSTTAEKKAMLRPSLKSDSEFNNYELRKQKLRENCFKRVRQDRSRLLWKCRLSSSDDDSSRLLHNQDELDIVFRDIVSDELNKINNDDNDLLWNDDLKAAHEGDCQDILLEMQNLFYQDLDSHIDTWEDEVDHYLARAVYDHMHLNPDNNTNNKTFGEQIWCPLCKQGQLKDTHNLIYCTRCKLQLTKADELTLDFLRDRLAEVHMEHLDRGCRLKPRFCIKTKFNLTALYIVCEGCDTFEVVI